jgi:phosphatidate cytidylyltransferase
LSATQPAKRSDLPVRTASAVVMVAVAGVSLWLGGWAWVIFVALVAVGVLSAWLALVRGFVGNAGSRLAWNMAGAVYIGCAAALLLVLRSAGYSLAPVLTIVVAVIATDVGAYFAGRTFGGPKIAPRISPSKTWSGVRGGVVGAAIVWFVAARRWQAGSISFAAHPASGATDSCPGGYCWRFADGDAALLFV